MASKILWTEHTWNPTSGCSRVSPGCDNCYAKKMANRLKSMGQTKYANGFKLTVHPKEINKPMKWNKPSRIFVNSMSDLFHEDVPLSFIQAVFATMCKETHHQFQILTKRSRRLKELSPQLPWPENVWQGVTVENSNFVFRIEHLKHTPAKIKFLSLEPLLGPVLNLPLQGIHWVIVGGESGPRARSMHIDWVRNIRDQCLNANVPFFFKQWGSKRGKGGSVLDGRTWNQMPYR